MDLVWSLHDDDIHLIETLIFDPNLHHTTPSSKQGSTFYLGSESFWNRAPFRYWHGWDIYYQKWVLQVTLLHIAAISELTITFGLSCFFNVSNPYTYRRTSINVMCYCQQHYSAVKEVKLTCCGLHLTKNLSTIPHQLNEKKIHNISPL